MGRNFGVTARTCTECGAHGEAIHVCLAGSLCPMADINARTLGAALLWLRNHYEFASESGAPSELRAKVLARADSIIDRCDVSGADVEKMRRDFPAHGDETK